MSHDYPNEWTSEEYRQAFGMSSAGARQRLNNMLAGGHVERREVEGTSEVRSRISQKPHVRTVKYFVWQYTSGMPLQRED